MLESHYRPRYPVIRPNLVTDKLRGKLCEKKGAVEYCHSVAVIVSSQIKVPKHIVRQGLIDVAPVKLQGEEHYTRP